MTFLLRDDSIPTDASEYVLITDINPSGDNDQDALICRSEAPTTENGNWYFHPTQMTTDERDRIAQVRVNKTILK